MLPHNPKIQQIDPAAFIHEFGKPAFGKLLLEKAKYAVPQCLLNDFAESVADRRPLILDGPPGYGKTAFFDALRVCCNLDAFRYVGRRGRSDTLYSWRSDLQKIILENEVRNGKSPSQVLAHVYERDYLFLSEPLAAFDFASRSLFPPLLILDEVEKIGNQDDFLELLDFGMVWVSELTPAGYVGCPDRSKWPLVVLTVNDAEKLSGPFRSRCNVAYLPKHNFDEQVSILEAKISISPSVLQQIASLFYWIGFDSQINHTPGLREMLAFGRAVARLQIKMITGEVLESLLIHICKDRQDREHILLNKDHFARKAQTSLRKVS